MTCVLTFCLSFIRRHYPSDRVIDKFHPNSQVTTATLNWLTTSATSFRKIVACQTATRHEKVCVPFTTPPRSRWRHRPVCYLLRSLNAKTSTSHADSIQSRWHRDQGRAFEKRFRGGSCVVYYVRKRSKNVRFLCRATLRDQSIRTLETRRSILNAKSRVQPEPARRRWWSPTADKGNYATGRSLNLF